MRYDLSNFGQGSYHGRFAVLLEKLSMENSLKEFLFFSSAGHAVWWGGTITVISKLKFLLGTFHAVFHRKCFKFSLIYSSGGHVVDWSRPVCAVWYRVLWETLIFIFLFSAVVKETILSKAKVYDTITYHEHFVLRRAKPHTPTRSNRPTCCFQFHDSDNHQTHTLYV